MLFFINYAFNHKIITGEIMKRFTRLFLPLLLCVFFGTVFYMVSSEEAKNYPPVFLNPPSFVFPIAWTILYILIGVQKDSQKVLIPQKPRIRLRLQSIYDPK